MKSILFTLFIMFISFNAHSQTSTCSALLTVDYERVEEFYEDLETQLIKSKIFLNSSVFVTALKMQGGPTIIKSYELLIGLFLDGTEGLENITDAIITLSIMDETLFPHLSTSHQKDKEITNRYFKSSSRISGSDKAQLGDTDSYDDYYNGPF